MTTDDPLMGDELPADMVAVAVIYPEALSPSELATFTQAIVNIRSVRARVVGRTLVWARKRTVRAPDAEQ
jgi:hypothetical protein